LHAHEKIAPCSLSFTLIIVNFSIVQKVADVTTQFSKPMQRNWLFCLSHTGTK